MDIEKSLAPSCAFRRKSDGFCHFHHAACSCTGNCAACPERVRPVSPEEHRHEQTWLNNLCDLSTKAKRQQFRLRRADRYDVYRTCKCKHHYHSENHALECARGVLNRDGVPLSVYKCPFCGRYHLTKQMRRNLAHVRVKTGPVLPAEAVA